MTRKVIADLCESYAEYLQYQTQGNDFISFERISPWETSSIPVLNYDGDVHNFACCQANHNIVNKREHKKLYGYLKIIYKDGFITWFGSEIGRISEFGGKFDFELYDEPMFWISVKNTVYRLTYSHGNLRLCPNACSEVETLTCLDTTALDNVVQKHHKRMMDFDVINLNHRFGKKTIALAEYFEKGFFYAGPKYDFRDPHSNYSKISEIRNVQAKGGLFRVEIENITYPHTGYAYLDLEKIPEIVVGTKVVRHELTGF